MTDPAKPLITLHNALQKAKKDYRTKLEHQKSLFQQLTVKSKTADLDKILVEMEKTRVELGNLTSKLATGFFPRRGQETGRRRLEQSARCLPRLRSRGHPAPVAEHRCHLFFTGSSLLCPISSR